MVQPFNTVWTLDGKVVVDSQGRIILCAICPCLDLAPTITGTSFTGTGTALGTGTIEAPVGLAGCCDGGMPATLYLHIDAPWSFYGIQQITLHYTGLLKDRTCNGVQLDHFSDRWVGFTTDLFGRKVVAELLMGDGPISTVGFGCVFCLDLSAECPVFSPAPADALFYPDRFHSVFYPDSGNWPYRWSCRSDAGFLNHDPLFPLMPRTGQAFNDRCGSTMGPVGINSYGDGGVAAGCTYPMGEATCGQGGTIFNVHIPIRIYLDAQERDPQTGDCMVGANSISVTVTDGTGQYTPANTTPSSTWTKYPDVNNIGRSYYGPALGVPIKWAGTTVSSPNQNGGPWIYGLPFSTWSTHCAGAPYPNPNVFAPLLMNLALYETPCELGWGGSPFHATFKVNDPQGTCTVTAVG